MSKLAIVENDKVEGVDQHNVQGDATNPSPPPPPTVPYVGVASFDYVGKMTDSLSDFVNIDGQPVATVNSKSSLNPSEDAPGGGHHGSAGKNFQPPAPVPIPISLSIQDPIGEGTPSANAGSLFVNIEDEAVLLDRDSIDTCDGIGTPMNSTVTSENQSFVNISE